MQFYFISVSKDYRFLSGYGSAYFTVLGLRYSSIQVSDLILKIVWRSVISVTYGFRNYALIKPNREYR